MFRLFICWEIHGTQVCIPLKPLFSRHKRTMVQFTDEPTGNLDSKSGKVVAEEFRKINEELGKTLLMVTHDPQMASRCKRVIFLKDGYVMNDVRKEGTEEEFYRTIIGEMEKF